MNTVHCYRWMLFLGVLCCIALGNRTHYDVLGIRPGFTMRQLRKAYHAKALELHPDKHASRNSRCMQACKDEFNELQEAYSTLKDPARRDAYDSLISKASSPWHFDGRNWEFRAAPGESVDLAEAMRALKRHQERIRKEQERGAAAAHHRRAAMFASARVARFNPEKHVPAEHAWLVLACTESRANCRKHEAVFSALSDRLHSDGVSVRIGFLDCGARVGVENKSVCTHHFNIRKVSLLAIKRSVGHRSDGSGGSRATSIRIRNNVPLQFSSMHQYVLQVLNNNK